MCYWKETSIEILLVWCAVQSHFAALFRTSEIRELGYSRLQVNPEPYYETDSTETLNPAGVKGLRDVHRALDVPPESEGSLIKAQGFLIRFLHYEARVSGSRV